MDIVPTQISYQIYPCLDILKDEKITYSLNKETKNSVKIMTIHKSKGLEYPICYFTGLSSKFNSLDTKKRFLFDDKYGIITPYIKDGIRNTIIHSLYKNSYIREDLSERIRLLYVALTRAKEKMIFITSLKEEENDEVDLDSRLRHTSFSSILSSISDILIPYKKEISLNNIKLTKDYTIIQSKNILQEKDSNEKIEVKEFLEKNEIISQKHFSKVNNSLMTKEIKKNMEFGLELHSILEYFDFLKKDYSCLDIKYRKYIEKFLESPLLKKIDDAIHIYKEYEFVYQKESYLFHGIIDLMIEYQDSIDIIDYKTHNIKEKDYEKQLIGYKDYISLKSQKDIHIYLYSIMDSVYYEIK